jgi:ADP-ribose pyrophosphatase YjhB (NUDIX family)
MKTPYETLLAKYPNAPITTVRQELDEETFSMQKQKHESRNAEGGAIGVIWANEADVVLARRLGKLHAGWALIGGTVEQGQLFDVAFLQEAKEEAGVDVHIERLVALEQKVFVSPSGQELQMDLAVFEGVIADGQHVTRTPEAVAENLEVAVFPCNALPAEMILGDKAKLEKVIQERN